MQNYIDKFNPKIKILTGSIRQNHIIGIDEAGRGPLAGPVVVAGIKLESSIKYQVLRTKRLKDSKKLSAKQREEWFEILTSHPQIKWAVAKISPKVIDRINISQAANLGALRVHKKLCGNCTSRLRLKNKVIVPEHGRGTTFLDGGLKLPPHIPHEAIIKGDEKISAISAASIIAKVLRDRIMLRFHKKYPKYCFDLHKGYGTALHRERIKKFGRSDIHRKSFRIRDV